MFNRILKPMLLHEVDKPFNDENYIYELKYDGIRALIYVSAKEFKIITRNGNNVANLYPELKQIQKIVKNHQVIFDGEIVAFCDDKPDFSELQIRSHLKDFYKIKQMIDIVPVYFIAFDILYLDKDLTNLKLLERKKKLDTFSDTNFFMKTKIYNDGLKLFKQIQKLNLEGIVAKEKESIYELNTRTFSWLKVKNFRKDYFYVHGFIKLKDKYRLLLGEYHGKNLYFVGNVSIGKKNSILQKVLNQKKSNNKFINWSEKANYVLPENKILVYYMERTDNGLRQPFIKKEK